jgi:uncharacterized membrane protein
MSEGLMDTNSGAARHLAVDRLAAFTDGIFAIGITLLSLEVAVPLVESAASKADLVAALVGQWPSYVAYTVTFFIIGGYWINHHRMFNLLRGINHTFLILNIFALMAIAIIPFPNALLAEYLLNPELRGVAAVVYGLAMFALALMFNIVWRSAFGMRLMKPEADPVEIRKVLNSYLIGPIAYAAAVVIALFAPVVSLVIYALLPIGYLFEGPVGQVGAGYVDSSAEEG